MPAHVLRRGAAGVELTARAVISAMVSQELEEMPKERTEVNEAQGMRKIKEGCDSPNARGRSTAADRPMVLESTPRSP